MRTFLVMTLLAALGLLLQTTLLHSLRLGPAVPDLLLVLCAYLGLYRHTVGGAFGVFVALKTHPDRLNDADFIRDQAEIIIRARPTAVNLSWAVKRTLSAVMAEADPSRRVDAARRTAL